MRLTNKLGLPESLVDLISKHTHDMGDAEISITQLLRPMRQLILERRHSNDIEEDVSDRLWATYGTLMHALIAQEKDSALKERAFTINVCGVKVIGHIDNYHLGEKTISDYKFTSVWKRVFSINDWEKQLNLYKYLIASKGYAVERLQVIALYRDYAVSKRYEPNYPKSPIEVIPIRIWEPLDAMELFVNRVNAYKKALIELPLCTPEEKWQRETHYAVYQGNRKTARRVFKTYDEARELASMLRDANIVERAGLCIRCEYYCRVKNFCDQYKEEQEWRNNERNNSQNK